MNLFLNFVSYVKRLISNLPSSTAVDRHVIRYRFDHITAPWIGRQFTTKQEKEIHREKARICASCRYAKIKPGHDKRILFNRRLFLVKKFVCLQSQQDVTTLIDTSTCKISKWK